MRVQAEGEGDGHEGHKVQSVLQIFKYSGWQMSQGYSGMRWEREAEVSKASLTFQDKHLNFILQENSDIV